MPEIIISALLLIPAVIGTIAVVQDVMLYFLTPKKSDSPVLIVPFDSKDDNAEIILKGAGMRARLFGSRYCCKVIALDTSGEYKNSEICLMSFDDMNYVDICDREELLGRIIKD